MKKKKLKARIRRLREQLRDLRVERDALVSRFGYDKIPSGVSGPSSEPQERMVDNAADLNLIWLPPSSGVNLYGLRE